jgi:hypothetical protein
MNPCSFPYNPLSRIVCLLDVKCGRSYGERAGHAMEKTRTIESARLTSFNET